MKYAVTAALFVAGASFSMAQHVEHIPGHLFVRGDQVKWGPAPPAFPGAEIAILAGNPTKEGPFVFRLRFPAGYKIAPHTHPIDENVTVLSGVVHMGSGEKQGAGKELVMNAGDYVLIAKGTVHYLAMPRETVMQVHGNGPSGISFINPADDPRIMKEVGRRRTAEDPGATRPFKGQRA